MNESEIGKCKSRIGSFCYLFDFYLFYIGGMKYGAILQRFHGLVLNREFQTVLRRRVAIFILRRLRPSTFGEEEKNNK